MYVSCSTQTNRLITAVKKLTFSGVGETGDNLHVRSGRKNGNEREVLSVWCLVSKKNKTRFSKCHMYAYISPKGKPLCLVPQQWVYSFKNRNILYIINRLIIIPSLNLSVSPLINLISFIPFSYIK